MDENEHHPFFSLFNKYSLVPFSLLCIKEHPIVLLRPFFFTKYIFLFTMAPQKTRHNTRKPRLFQCTGYGDCHMVFTRSEHLARHAR